MGLRLLTITLMLVTFFTEQETEAIERKGGPSLGHNLYTSQLMSCFYSVNKKDKFPLV